MFFGPNNRVKRSQSCGGMSASGLITLSAGLIGGLLFLDSPFHTFSKAEISSREKIFTKYEYKKTRNTMI